MVFVSGQPISQSTCKFELKELKYAWAVVSAISKAPTESAEFFNTATGSVDTLGLQERYERITASGMLTDAMITKVEEIYEQGKQGITTSATHIAGNIITDLDGVKIVRFTYGSFDLTSDDVVNAEIEVSLTSSKIR